MKKTMAIVVAAIVFFSIFASSTFAVDGGTLTVASVSGSAGDTVNVEVNISDNPGIIATRIYISYDNTKLSLVAATDGGLLGSSSIFGNDYTVNPYTLLWEDGVAAANHTDDGVIATLQFRILDSTASGSTEIALILDAGSTFNRDLNRVPFATVNGTLTIVSQTPPIVPQVNSTAVVDDTCDCIYGLKTGVTQQEICDRYLSSDGGTLSFTTTTGSIGTGTVVEVRSSSDETVVLASYTIIIFGDNNGDGVVDAIDQVLMKSHMSGGNALDTATPNGYAVDFNGDGTINSIDMATMKSYIAGSKTINQSTGELN